MPGSEHDQEEAGSQEEIMVVLLRSLVFRQDRLEERMASDRGRGEAQTNPGREHIILRITDLIQHVNGSIHLNRNNARK